MLIKPNGLPDVFLDKAAVAKAKAEEAKDD